MAINTDAADTQSQTVINSGTLVGRDRGTEIRVSQPCYAVLPNEDVEVGDARLILKSPNGTRYSITVDNSGNLGATAI